jgi:hypothetical protein
LFGGTGRCRAGKRENTAQTGSKRNAKTACPQTREYTPQQYCGTLFPQKTPAHHQPHPFIIGKIIV